MNKRLNKFTSYLIIFCFGICVISIVYVYYTNFVNPIDYEPKKVFIVTDPTSTQVTKVDNPEKSSTQSGSVRNKNTVESTSVEDVRNKNTDDKSKSTSNQTFEWTEESALEHLKKHGMPDDAVVVNGMMKTDLTHKEIMKNEKSVSDAFALLNNAEIGTDEYFDAINNCIETLSNSSSPQHKAMAQFLRNKISEDTIVITPDIIERSLDGKGE